VSTTVVSEAQAPSLAPDVRASGRSAWRRYGIICGWLLAAALPLIGLISLLLRSQLDPNYDNRKVHFVLFVAIGLLVSFLGYVAGEAATKRGDARVLLISLAFLATGGFLALHALGTPGILFMTSHSGFIIAISIGLLYSAVFAFASAFVDVRPGLAPWVMRRRGWLRGIVLISIALWAVWTLARLAPLQSAASEGSSTSMLSWLAYLGAVLYAAAALRYWFSFRERLTLLPASIIACFVLLAEAMVGVAVTGERSWHASWWEWHGLVVVAYLTVAAAARREWHDERFRHLYLPSTRQRSRDVSVLFSDLAGFTSFSERSSPNEVATLLATYYEVAAPLIARQFRGEVEKFIGDGMMATFNSRGNQPDHAVRAASAGLALQRAIGQLADRNPGWPKLRVGVNTGEAVLCELGGHGHVAYTLIGDTINTGSRLEGQAPIGSVLIGSETYRNLPQGAVVEAMGGLMVKGKSEALEAYVLHALPN
jgi:class 3 adenylate cyclase